jgi:predicted transcriptional regulator
MMRTFGLSRFCSSQSGCATARAWFFGAASAGKIPTVEIRAATTAPANTFFDVNIVIPLLVIRFNLERKRFGKFEGET